MPASALVRPIALAVLAIVPALGLWAVLPAVHIALTALIVVGAYAAIYLVVARALGLPEAKAWMDRLIPRRGRG
jgi:hypothetical protein